MPQILAEPPHADSGEPGRPEPPSAAILRALAAKYRRLFELRRAHEADGTIIGREAARELARAFPGALRELDTLPMDEIIHRAEALEQAARAADEESGDGNPVRVKAADANPPRMEAAVRGWMAWMCAYHALARGALRVKRELAARSGSIEREPNEPALARLVVIASESAGMRVDPAFVGALVRPPRRRLNPAIFAEIGRLYAVDPDAVRARLFPPRRRPGPTL